MGQCFVHGSLLNENSPPLRLVESCAKETTTILVQVLEYQSSVSFLWADKKPENRLPNNHLLIQ